jgi:carboxypeptidase PM20D1
MLLMGHLDVVPVLEESISEWRQEPFGGEIVNDTIWGRGAIDDKIGVVGILESVELLLKNGFVPKRTVYLAFGHDEEIGGYKGAKIMAEYLKEQQVELEFVLDEGGSRIQGILPGIDDEIALIGLAEKGFITLELNVSMAGGHSSQPEKETAIDVLSKAVVKLKENPFPARITPVLAEMMEYIGPEMPFLSKMVMANQHILGFLLIANSEKTGSGNANVRTITAPTIFNSGVKENIIPTTAQASVNFRILPGESIATVTKKVIEIVNDDRITVKQGGNFFAEPSKESSTSSPAFKNIQKSILQVFPLKLVTPYLVVAVTDFRYYGSLTDNIFRFGPMKLTNANLKSFHGINERFPVSEFENSVRFYYQMIKNGASE